MSGLSVRCNHFMGCFCEFVFVVDICLFAFFVEGRGFFFPFKEWRSM